MPLSRPMTQEEDITLSMTTMVVGLVTKYPDNAKAVLGSIVANTILHINDLIETSNMTQPVKDALRDDIRTLCKRALRTKLSLVTPTGEATFKED